MLRKTVLEINLKALEYNFNQINSKTRPSTKLMAVVKANAYGSDIIRVAKKLESLNVDYFAVAYAPEGVMLREAGIKTPILVLITQVNSFSQIVDNNLEPSLYSFFFLNNFISFLKEKNIKKYPCHFKINSGLNRVGFKKEEIGKAIDLVKKCELIHIVSVYSHLAASEDISENKFTVKQIKTFTDLASKVSSQVSSRPMLHMSNTSGILNYPECEFDMVRCGIGLYGYSNFLDKSLVPVHRLRTVISQIIKVKKGETIGYNRSFKSIKPSVVGIIPLGHADGISRSFSKGGFVIINNFKAKIIGNICMDVFMVDLNGIPAKEGDEVIIFNQTHTAEDFAKEVGTISYEILTNLSPRISRKIID